MLVCVCCLFRFEVDVLCECWMVCWGLFVGMLVIFVVLLVVVVSYIDF